MFQSFCVNGCQKIIISMSIIQKGEKVDQRGDDEHFIECIIIYILAWIIDNYGVLFLTKELIYNHRFIITWDNTWFVVHRELISLSKLSKKSCLAKKIEITSDKLICWNITIWKTDRWKLTFLYLWPSRIFTYATILRVPKWCLLTWLYGSIEIMNFKDQFSSSNQQF